jgi:hypothetical protein
MPAGPGELGFVYFAVAKFAGYTAFCKWAIAPQLFDAGSESAATPAIRTLFGPTADLSGKVHSTLPAAWKAGAVRTLIGLAIGAVVGLAFWKIPYFEQHDLFDNGIFFLLLVPVRVGEWWLLLRWVYGEFPLTGKLRSAIIAEGILASFVLDALGVFTAFYLPGGMWVC